MELMVFKSLWGMDQPLEENIKKIAEAGYDGVESAIFYLKDKELLPGLLEKYKLKLIAQVIANGDSVEEHLLSFRQQMALAEQYGAIKINVHGGKDSFTFDEQKSFYEAALKVEKDLNIPTGHETHRGRPMFTPWTTAALLKEFPELNITADISHWLCVCESYLEDQQENLQLAAERTIHIHGRIGYPQGPQVPHPAAPEYAKEREVHEDFWQRVCEIKHQKKSPVVTFTPEYGPPGYLHTLPFTNQPVADLWQVCLWTADRFRDQYSKMFQG